MYNSIYPININYRKYNAPKQNVGASLDSQNSNTPVNQEQQRPQNSFPNGTKVSIDYNNGQINISQVLVDFRNTIIAINAPDDVRDEVAIYLGLVERESKKENPSREIVLANLKNASRVSDDFITRSLNKKSNVVEGWIDALFLQKINLKADPDEINPAFQLEFPKEAQEKIDAENEKKSIEQNQPEEQKPAQVEQTQVEMQVYPVADEVVEVDSEIEISDEKEISEKNKFSFSPNTMIDLEARRLFAKAKAMPKTSLGYTDAINLLNEALGILENHDDINQNIKAAIHFERGKIFDEYDYVDYALRDYHEATKALELNLKAQAFYKSGRIYDEFSEFSPALDNYLSSVAYSGEADNYVAQTTVLSKIADLYAKQYDIQNVDDFSALALERALSTNDEAILANTYSNNAQNYQYVGENEKALSGYRNALAIMTSKSENFEQTAHNYEQASLVMRKLGNQLKADKLQAKALQYYQKARLLESQLEEVN